MTVMPLEWVLGRDRVDNILPRRPASSQNSQANNDVPPPLEGLPPMNAEGLYRYLETLVGLVESQARAIETQALGQPSSSKGSSFDDFKKLDCFEKQKASYAAFMLDKEVDHW
ncbi:hypothetical protein CK203_097417 [Vitis vinifera]|uniref:Uncharacterized protein n=1 Tax=Vitis vinifera TaxID=29760 RepID=A0A438D996_VITVI|nr:hypothetical protein CK203_097417 [Vitis vinifera]